MLEKAVQKKVVDLWKKAGWLAIKLSTNGRFGSSGWPDYMFLKGGRAVFIEFKAAGKHMTALQQERAKQLIASGFAVWTCDIVEEGAELLENYT
jgi:Holliday junction resolvase